MNKYKATPIKFFVMKLFFLLTILLASLTSVNAEDSLYERGKDLVNKEDYEKVQEDDTIDVNGLTSFTPGVALQVVLNHKDGSTDKIEANHSYNAQQIEWFQFRSIQFVLPFFV